MKQANLVAKIPAGICAAMLAILLLAPRANAQSTWAAGCAGVPTAADGSLAWTPAHCQEFNGSLGPPDTSAWSFDLGNNGGWGNQEIEIYCGPPGYPANPSECPPTFSTATANSYVDGNGHLVVQVVNRGGSWYSARMKTQGVQTFQYGRVEASIMLPNTASPGLWPAFWWLGSNYPTVPWPNSGEADVMENWSPVVFDGPGPVQNRSTIHTAVTGGSGITGVYNFPSGQQADAAFYAYGVVWSANMLQFYVNSTVTPPAAIQPFFIITASDLQKDDTWPFNAGAFLMANVAVGGTLGGPTTNTVSPQAMTIDYVRAYKPPLVAAPALGQPAAITVTAGATTGNSATFTPMLAAGTGYAYFSCSTTAPNAACAIKTSDPLNQFVARAAANPPETLTVSVLTTSNAGAGMLTRGPHLFGSGLLIAIAAWGLIATRRGWRRRQVWRRMNYGLAVAAVTLAAFAIAGCGGNNNSFSQGNTGVGSTTGTAPGSYSVKVYAFTEANSSDGANGNADASVAIPLQVN